MLYKGVSPDPPFAVSSLLLTLPSMPHNEAQRISNKGYSPKCVELDFSHLGETALDTLLSPHHKKLRSRCLHHLPPTMVIGFLELPSCKFSENASLTPPRVSTRGTFCGLRWEVDPRKARKKSREPLEDDLLTRCVTRPNVL